MGHKQLVNDNPSQFYPPYLRKIAASTKLNRGLDGVIVIDMNTPDSIKKLKELVETVPIHEVVDNYSEQFAELLTSKNAHLYRANHDVQVSSISDMLAKHYGDIEPWKLGSWVYYPWSTQLIHVLDQLNFEDLRTIRNRDLITSEEQTNLSNFDVICFGMSVGSASALALAISGISRRIKLIDGAVISGSNLNRILTGISSVGQSKALVTGQKIYEMNPYSQVICFDKVLENNIDSIFDTPWTSKLAIDEIDDIEMKIRLRIEARKRQIPVVMASEMGDTVMLDVERFDLEPNRPLFHGIIPDIDKLASTKLTNHREWMKYAVKILDPQNMPIKMQQSLLRIGSTIVTHPQLGSTVMMTGGVVAFAVKNIALGNSMLSGRYVISLENILLADHKTYQHRKLHKKHTKVIQTAIDSM